MNPSPPKPLVKSERLFLLTVAGMQFTHVLDFMIMIPLGPQLTRLLQIDTRQFGLLLSSYTFAAMLSGLLSTFWIDRFDRRKLILGVYAMFTVATVCCGFAQSFGSLLAARALAGAFGGIIGSMVYTICADVIPFERRAKATGVLMGAFSLSTVAGIPSCLFLADAIPALTWRAPFFFLGLLCIVFAVIGLHIVPSLTAHVNLARQDGAVRRLATIALHPNHMKAFALMALVTLGGFSVLPYIALYLTSNVGVSESFLSTIYLCSGASTMATTGWLGSLADRHGKLKVFTWLALLAVPPLLYTTHMGPTVWWAVLLSQALFFVIVPGRFVPAMAMITSAATPQVRGTFMSLAFAVQMLSIGLSSLITGMVLTRTPSGQIEHFNLAGYFAVACGLAAIWVARRLRVAQ